MMYVQRNSFDRQVVVEQGILNLPLGVNFTYPGNKFADRQIEANFNF